jgi:hypothetical protein
MVREFDPKREPARDNQIGIDTTSGDLRMDPAIRNRTGMGSLGIMPARSVHAIAIKPAPGCRADRAGREQLHAVRPEVKTQ